MKQKINNFLYRWPAWLILILLFMLFLGLYLDYKENSRYFSRTYEATCLTGTYQVYHDGFNFYLQENGKEFWDYGNCVFVEK